MSDFNNEFDHRAVQALIGSQPQRVVVRRYDHWELVEYVSTGELKEVRLGTDDVRMSADVPVRAPKVLGAAGSLDDLAPEHRDEPVRHPGAPTKEDRARFRSRDLEFVLELRERLRRDLAPAIAALGRPDRLVCTNCDERGGFIMSCDCGQSTTTHLGLVAGSNDIVVEEARPFSTVKSDEAPLADCPRCAGTGERWSICVACSGIGEHPGRVHLEILPPGGGKRTVDLDLAALLSSGELGVKLRPVCGADRLRVNVDIDVTPLNEIFERDFLDDAPGLVYAGGSPMRFGALFSGSASLEFRVTGTDEAPVYSLATRRRGDVDIEPFVLDAAVVESLAEELVDTFAGPYRWLDPDDDSYRIEDGGKVLVRTYTLTPDVPTSQRLDRMSRHASIRGFYLAFGTTFIATGEIGPEVLLLDNDRRPVSQLAVGYDWHLMLAMAERRLLRILNDGN